MAAKADDRTELLFAGEHLREQPYEDLERGAAGPEMRLVYWAPEITLKPCLVDVSVMPETERTLANLKTRVTLCGCECKYIERTSVRPPGKEIAYCNACLAACPPNARIR